jgi:hypothetical protein
MIRNVNPDPVFIIDDLIKDELHRNDIVSNEAKYFICTFPKKSVVVNKWFNDFRKAANNGGILVGQLPLPDGISDLEFDFTVPYPIDPIQWYLWLKNSSGFIGM